MPICAYSLWGLEALRTLRWSSAKRSPSTRFKRDVGTTSWKALPELQLLITQPMKCPLLEGHVVSMKIAISSTLLAGSKSFQAAIRQWNGLMPSLTPFGIVTSWSSSPRSKSISTVTIFGGRILPRTATSRIVEPIETLEPILTACDGKAKGEEEADVAEFEGTGQRIMEMITNSKGDNIAQATTEMNPLQNPGAYGSPEFIHQIKPLVAASAYMPSRAPTSAPQDAQPATAGRATQGGSFFDPEKEQGHITGSASAPAHDMAAELKLRSDVLASKVLCHGFLSNLYTRSRHFLPAAAIPIIRSILENSTQPIASVDATERECCLICWHLNPGRPNGLLQD
ncbi:hypothetical protein CC86DRAFT_432560 [Ophiobolus disseminans]|uniref:Uncharacterized protein n=1 Tax=Ophiobolus disseminans TaxID=1469910 RepID=A0A6A6ZDQ9_9PLEO|nr:hypothetical protein CC86DRAFT_432560 [Ophiobolus disseminans]